MPGESLLLKMPKPNPKQELAFRERHRYQR